MAHVELDTTELDRFVEVLQRAPSVTAREAERMVSKGALNVKKRAQELAPKGPHTPHYAKSITYDVTRDGDLIEAEIGPAEGRRQRGLGNLLEYGSPRNPPHPHLEPALDEEEPRFYEAAEKLAGDFLDG